MILPPLLMAFGQEAPADLNLVISTSQSMEQNKEQFMTTPKIVPLNKEQHAATKITNTNAFNHIRDEHMLPVAVHEFVVAGAEFPIVFVKNSDKDTYQPVIMLGLSAKQNLFVTEKGWEALYVPRAIRNYPLVLVQDKPDGDRLLVALDEGSERVTKQEGTALFNEDGSETEFLTNRKKQMVEFMEMSQITRGFVEKLQSLELIKEQVLTLNVKGEERRINGIHLIDEQKLNSLSNEVFLELRKSGYLTAIYAHLMSLQHTQKLVQKIAMAS